MMRMSQGIFSRVDAYLAYALREIDTYPAHQSRLDNSLIELADTVRLGGASPDVIRPAVNPPAGMTDSQPISVISYVVKDVLHEVQVEEQKIIQNEIQEINNAL